MTFRIGIVGGGPSGCAAAVALCSAAEDQHGPVDVTIIERQALYKGRTFNTGDPTLLLNTSAGVTSVRAEAPDDFVAFLQTRQPATPADFAARTDAAAYLKQTLAGLRGRSFRLRLRQAEVRNIEQTADGALSVQSEASRLVFDTLVLAMGAPFKPLDVAPTVRYVSPYPVSQLDEVEPDDSVLIVGSHLTAIDACVWLHAKGHRGPVTMISRSGRLPAVRRSLLHDDAGRDAEHALAQTVARRGGTRLERLGHVLAQRGRVSIAGIPNGRIPVDGAGEFIAAWKESEGGVLPWERLIMFAIDTLNAEWPRTTAAERRTFQAAVGTPLLRFLSAMPLRNARILGNMVESGQLTVAAGSLDHAGQPVFDGPPPANVPDRFDAIVNATGLGRPAEDPFIADLARKRLVRINADGGVCIDPATCRASPALPIYALGPVAVGTIYTSNFLYSSVRSAQGLKAILPRGRVATRQQCAAAWV